MSSRISIPQDPSLLRQWFDKMDKNRTGMLNVAELQAALSDAGLNFSLSTVAHIIRFCDKTNSGTITFEEFLKLHNFLAIVQASFNQFDVDRDGRLSYDEIEQALQLSGYPVDRPALAAVLRRFDPLRRSWLELPEFLALVLFLRSAATVFSAFDPLSSGVVHLNYNQLLYAAANIL